MLWERIKSKRSAVMEAYKEIVNGILNASYLRIFVFLFFGAVVIFSCHAAAFLYERIWVKAFFYFCIFFGDWFALCTIFYKWFYNVNCKIAKKLSTVTCKFIITMNFMLVTVLCTILSLIEKVCHVVQIEEIYSKFKEVAVAFTWSISMEYAYTALIFIILNRFEDIILKMDVGINLYFVYWLLAFLIMGLAFKVCIKNVCKDYGRESIEKIETEVRIVVYSILLIMMVLIYGYTQWRDDEFLKGFLETSTVYLLFQTIRESITAKARMISDM